MTRVATFVSGMLLGGTLVGLAVLWWKPVAEQGISEHWRVRASEAERRLASLQEQVAVLSAQQESVAVRRESAVIPTVLPTVIAPECAPVAEEPALPLQPPLQASLLAPSRQHEWNALVAGTLQFEVHRRLGRTLTPEQEHSLVETLARLRDAALELGQEPLDAEEPTDLGEHLIQTIVLLEADRTFRSELGMGVSDFLQGLEKDQIEEVFPRSSVPFPES